MCARICVEVAQVITFEATRLLRLVNSITQLTPHVGIFCSVLSDITRDANTFFRDHRLPVTVILNQLVLWYVRGGGMQAAAAALAASFAQAQHFLPHRLIVRWQLQKNALSTQEVDFLQELVVWIDPSYVSEASSSSSLSSPAAAAALRLPTAPPLIQRGPLPVQHQWLASIAAGAHQLPPCAIRLDPCCVSL